MNLPKQTQTLLADRTCDTWFVSLCGEAGSQAQQNALQDLANSLYIVAYNYLYRSQAASGRLHSFSRSELAVLAAENVGCFMAKLVNTDFILLNKFSHKGRFATWIAAMFLRTMASERIVTELETSNIY